MSYLDKKQKPCKTPLPKGLLNYCQSCVYYIHQEPDQPKIKYPCRKSHQQVRKASGINYARDFRDCDLYGKSIQFVGINYIRQRIMSIEERQQVIREYLDVEKVNVPFLIQILPDKYAEKHKRETLIEELIPDGKLGWKFFLLVLLINVVLILLVDWVCYAK